MRRVETELLEDGVVCQRRQRVACSAIVSPVQPHRRVWGGDELMGFPINQKSRWPSMGTGMSSSSM